MFSTIRNISADSPDALIAVNESESRPARVEIVVKELVASGGCAVSIATWRKGLCPCKRGISKWWRQ